MKKAQLKLFPIESSERSGTDGLRPIHYLGSKLRFIEPIRKAIESVAPSGATICDLFAGSGTVSAALAQSNNVVAADIQEYSRVLCSAILTPATVSDADARDFIARAFSTNHASRLRAAAPLIEYEEYCLQKAQAGETMPLCELIDCGSILAFSHLRAGSTHDSLFDSHHRTIQNLREAGEHAAAETLVLRHFGGLYFSYLQAIELDALLTAAQQFRAKLRDVFLAATISTASEIVNTVGKHFAQPIRPLDINGRPKPHLIGKILRDRKLIVRSIFAEWLQRYRSIQPTGRPHQAIRGDFAEVLFSIGKSVDVVYADPPYTRDHYSRFYHVIETMCLWDEPRVSTTLIRSDYAKLSRGMYRTDRHQSPFCIRSQAPTAFEKLFSSVRDIGASLVLSYSPYASNKTTHPRVMTVSAIKEIAMKIFRRVEIVSAGQIAHSKLNTTRHKLDAATEAEFIFICKN